MPDDGSPARKADLQAAAFEYEQRVLESHAPHVGHRARFGRKARDDHVRKAVHLHAAPARAVVERSAGRKLVRHAADLGDVAALDPVGVAARAVPLDAPVPVAVAVVDVIDHAFDDRTRQRTSVIGLAGLRTGFDGRQHRVAGIVGREVGDHRAEVVAAFAAAGVGDLRRAGLGGHAQPGGVPEIEAGGTLCADQFETPLHLAQRRARADRRGEGAAFEPLLDAVAAPQFAHQHGRDHFAAVGDGVVEGDHLDRSQPHAVAVAHLDQHDARIGNFPVGGDRRGALAQPFQSDGLSEM